MSAAEKTETAAKTLKDKLLDGERLFEETGCYSGVEKLELRDQDPMKYESLHIKLRSMVVSAREMARRISASPGVREVGESVVAIYTPEGDAIALSTGIMVHVHTASRFIKWMIQNDYEDSPKIRPGDIFANNDAFIGTVQAPDVIDVIPIFHEDELIGWVAAVCHELEVGGITPGGDVALSQERFTEGLMVCAEKVGENDELRRDYLIRLERNLRMPIYWVLDEKAKVAACLEVREQLLELVDQIGVDYYKQATKEFIEEGRRAQLARVRQLTVPGRYRGHTFFGHVTEGKQGVLPLGNKNWLYAIPMEMEISAAGELHLDFDGTNSWGYHSMNCTPAGMDGGLFVTLTQHMNFDGKVNDGAWLATGMNLPPGTWTNPQVETAATATSWALLLPAFGCFQRMLSRGFLGRGFKEEVFVGQVNSPMIEMGGQSQYGSMFGIALFECAAAGSGALAIKDGLDTAYVGWNPESDMGNMEIWEQDMPMVYLGRTISPNSGGYGRYRGGTGFESLWVVNQTPQLIIATSEHSSRVFDNAGMCGGYPAPTVQLHYASHDANIKDLAANRAPLPHSLGDDPHETDIEKLLPGSPNVVEGPYLAEPLRDGDVFAHSYNGGGGYGDPLERDADSVARDVANGYVTAQSAEAVYGVVVQSGARSCEVDAERTAARRRRIREDRSANAVPARDWIAQQRQRVVDQDFAVEVREMYRDSMTMSDRFAAEMREFWSLPADFEFAPRSDR
ncbi:hydantoinase B/oxoprolinase family protein [Saccharopolyspora sp. WRP15-2]|uniref:Hydantoinase B/oxoprolinase family protein n=1 Tax=Saccharopolyspora oryzae TaxID=2997343 RepID=A0ABT4UTZ0_9PSEU|nr:hydantoinase B/oxoprolinase family protein [Saccharopolyspora oryzae]MDA3625192.1 hydantoinase B/oxoprolinase family protein [Saccharopolyspora oryzae]